MNFQIESIVLRVMAVLALATAIVVMGTITSRSGLIGGKADVDPAGGTETVTAGAGTEESTGESEEAAQVTATRKHIVEDGDSFYSIARKYNVSIDEIKRLNPDLDVQHLTPGLSVAIP